MCPWFEYAIHRTLRGISDGIGDTLRQGQRASLSRPVYRLSGGPQLLSVRRIPHRHNLPVQEPSCVSLSMLTIGDNGHIFRPTNFSLDFHHKRQHSVYRWVIIHVGGPTLFFFHTFYTPDNSVFCWLVFALLPRKSLYGSRARNYKAYFPMPPYSHHFVKNESASHRIANQNDLC